MNPSRSSLRQADPVGPAGETEFFRLPGICWPQVRRQTLELLLYTAADFFEILATRGRSLLWTAPDAEQARYRAAQSRLRKSGWIAYQRGGGRDPVLREAPHDGAAHLPPALRPRARWNRRWRGTWWLLAYDVPESNRHYRQNLRRFVKRMGMGRLQDSVFLSPDDPRAEFRDLADAAGADTYAILLAVRAVFGQTGADLARKAWPLDELSNRQADFERTARRALEQVESGAFDAATLRRLREEAFGAYLDVMARDPLLPRAVWPGHYAGERAFHSHADLQKAILLRLP